MNTPYIGYTTFYNEFIKNIIKSNTDLYIIILDSNVITFYNLIFFLYLPESFC